VSVCSRPTPSQSLMGYLLFDKENGWERAKSMAHPTLNVDVASEDYAKLNRNTLSVQSSTISVVTELYNPVCGDLKTFSSLGSPSQISVKQSLLAANKKKIEVLLRLSGMSCDGQKCHFYWSRDVLVQLDVISFNFPQLGAAIHQSSVQNQPDQYACLKRTKLPLRPHVLPFKCVPKNNGKMRDWLLDRYSTSTFNQCTHQQLLGMTGHAISFYVDKDAKPLWVY